MTRYAAIAAALLAVCLGCSRGHLNEVYGRRTGGGANSVNGTSVLGEMFKRAGHRVRSWRYLSPSLEEADVIVWFPHSPSWRTLDPGTPSAEAVAWLDDWLQYGEGPKTLIYVGGGWRAAVEYWSQTRSAAPAAQQPEFGQRLRDAQKAVSERLAAKVESLQCDWFQLERGATKTSVQALSGPFAEGIDAGNAGLEHWSSLHGEDDDQEVLLDDGRGHPLVSEVVYDASKLNGTDDDSRLILVENAGFLLNGALVNQERRKLAGRLIAHVGPPQQRVLFLETGPDPPIRDTDPNPRPPTGLELFGIWPVGAVLAQVAALFVAYSCACWPIFGTPRRLKPPSLTDYGRHVHALARLLAATRDRSYAVTQLNTYFQVGSAPGREGGAPGEPDATKNLRAAGGSGDAPRSREPIRTPTSDA